MQSVALVNQLRERDCDPAQRCLLPTNEQGTDHVVRALLFWSGSARRVCRQPVAEFPRDCPPLELPEGGAGAFPGKPLAGGIC